MTASVLHVSLLFLALFSYFCFSVSEPETTFFTFAVKKDPSTNLYYSSVGIGTPRQNMDLVLDLGGQMLWFNCGAQYNSSSYHPIACDSQTCPIRSLCVGCSGPFKPGCTNNTCGVYTINPLASYIIGGGLGEDVLYLSNNAQVPRFLSGCTADTSTFEDGVLQGLPAGSKGIMGLGWTQLALPLQLAWQNVLPLKFSLCLPSLNSNKKGSGNGNIVIGGTHTQFSTKFIHSTLMIYNPVSTSPVFVRGVPSDEYFIDVKAIKIDGKVIKIKPSLLSFDKKGNGGTKLSTMNPYTILHNSIYRPFVRNFVVKALKRKMKRVASVAPFEACFDSSSVGNTMTGLNVPNIHLLLEGGVQWTIYGSNSMVFVNQNVACLGFVDGGTRPKRPFFKTSIIIGGHQLEDNLLEFDLNSSKLSFSSSLLLQNASCSHF